MNGQAVSGVDGAVDFQTASTRPRIIDAASGFANFGILHRPELLYAFKHLVLRLVLGTLTNTTRNEIYRTGPIGSRTTEYAARATLLLRF